MANNKQKVEEILKRLTEDNKGKEGFYGIDTLTIAEELELRRNVVSQYLNELVDEKKAIKSKTRPVLFTYIDSNEKVNSSGNDGEDIFRELVGYNGSLKTAVKQCKSAAFYPSKDLSLIHIFGINSNKKSKIKMAFKAALFFGAFQAIMPFIGWAVGRNFTKYIEMMDHCCLLYTSRECHCACHFLVSSR